MLAEEPCETLGCGGILSRSGDSVGMLSIPKLTLGVGSSLLSVASHMCLLAPSPSLFMRKEHCGHEGF